MRQKPKLPTTLAGLLRVALDDLGRVLRDNTYYPWSIFWHSPVKDRIGTRADCFVCAAGAVMAKTLGLNSRTNHRPGTLVDAAHADIAGLDAINAMREGRFPIAARHLGITLEKPQLEALRETYNRAYKTHVHTAENHPGQFCGEDDTVEFILQMREVQAKLEELNL